MTVRSWPNFLFYFSISLEEMTKAIVKISENNQCLDSDMKQIPLQQKYMRLLCEPPCSYKESCGLIQRSTIS